MSIETQIQFHCKKDGSIYADTLEAKGRCVNVMDLTVRNLGSFVRESKKEQTLELYSGQPDSDVYLSGQGH